MNWKLKKLAPTALSLLISATAVAQQTCPQTGNGQGNLITNGDFEGCIDGTFSSDYTQSRDCGGAEQITPGLWGVADQANEANSFFANITDHTGGGNMMIIDVDASTGAGGANKNAYCTTVNVTSNTTYFFSAWIANINTSNASGNEICDWIEPGAYCDNPPVLRFIIDGQPVGDTVFLPEGDNGWHEFYAPWNSGGASGTVEICLQNLNTLHDAGNDLALDDVSFTSNCANVEAAVVFDPLTDLPDVMSTCYEGGQVTLETGLSTNDIAFTWKDQNKDVFGGNDASQVISTADGEGYYYVCMDPIEGGQGIGCPQADSVLIENNLTVTIPDLTLCDPPTATLNTGIPDADLFNIEWTFNGDVIGGEEGATLEATQAGVYCVNVTGAPGCDASDCGTIDSDAPTPIDGTFCPVDSGGSGMATLGIDGAGDYRWFATETSTNELHAGDTYLVGPLTEETTFYVQDLAPIEATVGPSQPATCNENDYLSNNTTHGMIFDVHKEFTLNNITVEVGEPGAICWQAGATYDVTVNINGPGFSQSITANTPCTGNNTNSARVLDLGGVVIPAGSGYVLDLTGNDFQINRCPNGTYPQTDALGVKTITGRNSTGNDAANIAAIYDWGIEVLSDCGRVPVTATIDCPPCEDPVVDVTTVDPVTICPGDNVTLTAEATPDDDYTYLWSTGENTSVITVDAAGDYSVIVSIPGCDGTDNLEVTENPTPTVEFTGDTEICLGEDALLTIDLNGTGPYDVEYTNGGANFQLNGIADGETILVSPLATTTYTPTSVEDAICPGDTLGGATITVNPLPIGSITGEETICLGDTADITFNFTGVGPFTATIEVNGVAEDVTDLQDGDVWRVSPVVTTTYRMTLITDANGCESIPAPEDAIITVEVLPGAELGGGATLCLGDTTELTFNLEGTGPFDVVYTDGTTEFTLDDVDDGHVVTIIPTGSVTYSMISVAGEGGAGCPGPTLGTAEIVINPLPTVEITQDIGICEGENTDLTLTFTGASPFDVTYEDDINPNPYNLNGAVDGELINVAPDTTTTYTMLTVADANGCEGAVEGNPATVTVNQAPTFTNQEETCEAGGPPFAFTVSFDIEGGDPGSYIVDPAGTLVGAAYTSDVLDNLTNYSFSVDDINGCGPVLVEGTKDCSCVTDVGTMDVTAQTLCDGVTATAIWNEDSLMEPGDVVMYILHDNPGTNDGTILDQGATPDFDFIGGTMTYGETYYISAVLGPDGADLNGLPDLTDGCTRVAAGTPVQWIELPTAAVGDTAEICLGLDTDLEFTMTGNGPFTVVYTDGTDDFTLTDINSGHLETVSPAVSTTYSIVSVADATTPTACVGNGAGDPAYVDIVLPATATVPTFVCSDDKTTFVVNFEVNDAVVGTYEINDPGTLTGNAFESEPLVNLLPTDYSFTVTSLNTCPNLVVEGQGTCECETDAGTMTGNPLILCEDEDAVAVHNGDEVLEDDDDMMFVLKTGFGTALGTIVATNNMAPFFSYNGSLNYGQTYFLATVAGNSDGQGGVDITDPCLSVSPPIPVVWNEIPHGTILGDTTICAGSPTYLSFELSGSPPFDVVYTDGVQNFSLNGIENGHLEQITPTESVTYTIVSIDDSGIAGCEGTFDGDADITVPALLEISEVSPPVSCNGDCNGIAVVNILTDNANDADFDFQWFDGEGVAIAGATNQALNNLCVGDYIVQVTDREAGCTATTSASITEPEAITIVFDSSVNPSCAGFSDGQITVSAAGGTVDAIERYTWLWDDPQAQTDSMAIGLTAGEHTIEVTDVNGCTKDTAFTIVDPDPVLVEANTEDRLICLNGLATLEATPSGGAGNYTFLWSTDGTVSDTTAQSPTASPAIATTYQVIAIDENGCPSDPATVDVALYDEVVISAGVINPIICLGEESQLFHGATNGNVTSYTFAWSTGDIGLTDQDTVPVFPDSTTTYTVAVLDGCGSTDTANVTVVVNPTPEPAISAVLSPQCESVIVDFVNNHPGDVASTCVWDFGNGNLSNGSCESAQHEYTVEEKFTISVTMTSDDAAGCVADASLDTTMEFAPKPDAFFVAEPEEAPMFLSEITFTDGSSTDAEVFDWSFGDGATDTVQHPIHEYDFTQPGTYQVQLTVANQYGCTDIHLDTIVLTGDYSIYVPSAFTPNGDGDNETFFPVTVGLNEVDFYIYDRWGELVFHGTDLGDYWDGTVKDKDAKQDVYTWQIYANSAWLTEEIFRTGRVTLVR